MLDVDRDAGTPAYVIRLQVYPLALVDIVDILMMFVARRF
jgi:hypothetical protein